MMRLAQFCVLALTTCGFWRQISAVVYPVRPTFPLPAVPVLLHTHGHPHPIPIVFYQTFPHGQLRPIHLEREKLSKLGQKPDKLLWWREKNLGQLTLEDKNLGQLTLEDKFIDKHTLKDKNIAQYFGQTYQPTVKIKRNATLPSKVNKGVDIVTSKVNDEELPVDEHGHVEHSPAPDRFGAKWDQLITPTSEKVVSQQIGGFKQTNGVLSQQDTLFKPSPFPVRQPIDHRLKYIQGFLVPKRLSLEDIKSHQSSNNVDKSQNDPYNEDDAIFATQIVQQESYKDKKNSSTHWQYTEAVPGYVFDDFSQEVMNNLESKEQTDQEFEKSSGLMDQSTNILSGQVLAEKFPGQSFVDKNTDPLNTIDPQDIMEASESRESVESIDVNSSISPWNFIATTNQGQDQIDMVQGIHVKGMLPPEQVGGLNKPWKYMDSKGEEELHQDMESYIDIKDLDLYQRDEMTENLEDKLDFPWQFMETDSEQALGNAILPNGTSNTKGSDESEAQITSDDGSLVDGDLSSLLSTNESGKGTFQNKVQGDSSSKGTSSSIDEPIQLPDDIFSTLTNEEPLQPSLDPKRKKDPLDLEITKNDDNADYDGDAEFLFYETYFPASKENDLFVQTEKPKLTSLSEQTMVLKSSENSALNTQAVDKLVIQNGDEVLSPEQPLSDIIFDNKEGPESGLLSGMDTDYDDSIMALTESLNENLDLNLGENLSDHPQDAPEQGLKTSYDTPQDITSNLDLEPPVVLGNLNEVVQRSSEELEDDFYPNTQWVDSTGISEWKWTDLPNANSLYNIEF